MLPMAKLLRTCLPLDAGAVLGAVDAAALETAVSFAIGSAIGISFCLFIVFAAGADSSASFASHLG